MPAESLNIYGLDDTSTAAEVASAALANPHPGNGERGGRASEGGGGGERVSNGEVSIKSQGGGNDSRAVSKGGHSVGAQTSSGRKER